MVFADDVANRLSQLPRISENLTDHRVISSTCDGLLCDVHGNGPALACHFFDDSLVQPRIAVDEGDLADIVHDAHHERVLVNLQAKFEGQSTTLEIGESDVSQATGVEILLLLGSTLGSLEGHRQDLGKVPDGDAVGTKVLDLERIVRDQLKCSLYGIGDDRLAYGAFAEQDDGLIELTHFPAESVRR